MSIRAALLLLLFVLMGCAPAAPKSQVPPALLCTAGAPESPVVELVPVPKGEKNEPPASGQMTEDAALAKRLFDSERWAEASTALQLVANGNSGDDLGNRQIAAYHAAIAEYRLGHHAQALEQFLQISRDRQHLKWNETLLWLARLLETPDTAEGALSGIALYDFEQVARFNNPQQRLIFSRLQMALGRVAYRRGAYGVAIGFFSNVDKQAEDLYQAARDCTAQAELRKGPGAANDVPAEADAPAAHASASVAPPNSAAPLAPPPDAAAVVASLRGSTPHRFGDHIRGIKRAFQTDGNEIALTLDLCDGIGEGAIDEELFALLRREKIPAAVFVSGRFAQNHTDFVEKLASEPQFTIENHGYRHRPCTADGRSVFGIAGTRGVESMVDEIEENARLITKLTGRRPQLYRPGTAHMDDVCVRAAKELSTTPLGFTVSGDVGASLHRKAVKQALLGAKPGSIVVLHAHRPRSESFEGLRDALPFLKERGTRFVSLTGALLTE